MHYNEITTALALLVTVAAPAAAFFKVPCTSPVVVERADPVISPGKVSSHAHTVMGGNGFGFSMNYAQARAASCSTCKAKGDNSNYWIPSVYFQASNGSFISVQQNGGMLVYYQQRTEPGSDETSLVPFPPEFRMVAGDPMKRSDSGDNAAKAVSFACLDYNGPATKETNFLPTRNCPSGLRVQVYFPSCWNGVDTDSPDHKSHMSYPSNYNGGTCPPGYPKRVISLFYEVIWNTNEFKDLWDGRQQPFVLANGDPTGYGYHGDFVNGWDIPTLTDAIHNCRDGNGGTGGHNGDINQCPPLLPLRSDSEANGCKIPTSINEQLTGVLSALPGCNPVTPGPERATPQSGCGAPTTIGKPETFFTDLTESKHWEYVGCGTDVAFKARTLSGANTANDQMTVEKCIDYCISAGTTYAGLEYGRECYCGDTIPADRAPVTGLVGNCLKPCAGDAHEFCGGAQTISLYKKCDGTGCKNNDVGVVGNASEPATGGSGYTPDSSPTPSSTKAYSSSAPSASPVGSSSPFHYGADGGEKYVVEPGLKAVASPTGSVSSTPSSVPEAGAASPTDGPTIYAVITNASSNVVLPEGWRAVGCYVDPVRPTRALRHYGWFGKPMTSSGCAKYCDFKGYTFAGTENAGQCFCGNKLLGGKAANAEDCSSKCKGSDEETCGGPARLSLFTKLKADAGSAVSRRGLGHRHHIGGAHKAVF